MVNVEITGSAETTANAEVQALDDQETPMRRRTALPDAAERCYGTSAVAKAAGVDPSTVIKAIRSGQLAARRTRPGAGHYRIPESAFRAWLSSLQVVPAVVEAVEKTASQSDPCAAGPVLATY